MSYARAIERLYTSGGGGGIGDYSFYGYAPEEPPHYCSGCGAFDREPCICEPEWLADADAHWLNRLFNGEYDDDIERAAERDELVDAGHLDGWMGVVTHG